MRGGHKNGLFPALAEREKEIIIFSKKFEKALDKSNKICYYI